MNYDHIADIHSHVHNDCHHILQEQPNIIHIHLYSLWNFQEKYGV